jgi:hypothetical protein
VRVVGLAVDQDELVVRDAGLISEDRRAVEDALSPRAAPKAYMRSCFGRSWPWVAWTSRMLSVSFAFPSATAPESIVRRCEWYQAVPSRFWRPHPENISA